jgi:hypothetical protein
MSSRAHKRRFPDRDAHSAQQRNARSAPTAARVRPNPGMARERARRCRGGPGGGGERRRHGQSAGPLPATRRHRGGHPVGDSGPEGHRGPRHPGPAPRLVVVRQAVIPDAPAHRGSPPTSPPRTRCTRPHVTGRNCPSRARPWAAVRHSRAEAAPVDRVMTSPSAPMYWPRNLKCPEGRTVRRDGQDHGPVG